MKVKRALSLVLTLLMAFSLFAGISPAAQANDVIGDLLDRYFFQKDYLDQLFNESNLVKQGTCGINEGANVWYQIYEITAADLSGSQFFQTLAQYTDDGYLALDPSDQYYGVKIFGNGQMENYKRMGYSAPWCDHVTLDLGPYKNSPIEVDMDKKLILGYVAGAGDHKVLSNGTMTTVNYKTGVTNVGQFAFFGQDMLSAVYLGDSVQRIEDRAFESTEMLAAINMPSALEYLGKRAFYGCDKLTYWRAGSCLKLTEIGERAFYGNSLLASVQFPANLKVIGKMAFAWCRILGDENFVLPSGLTTIGDGAFMFDTHMGRINEINIPIHVQTIGNYAFLCCFGIGKGENDGLSFTPDGTAPLSIGQYAFAGCRELKNLKLDNRVTNIHAGAFAACERLENVVFGADQNAKQPTIDSFAFTSMQSAAVSALELVSGFMSESGDEASEFVPTLNYDDEEMAAFTDLTAMTPLRDAAFQGSPAGVQASKVVAATKDTRSFPADCIVHYPSVDPANAAWKKVLDPGATTWQGYQTVGDWTDHFHKYAPEVTKEATHTQDGVITYTCSVCQNSYTEIVPKGHDYQVAGRTEPTCTTDGAILYECKRSGCSNKYYEEPISALGHENLVTVDPTCTEEGHRTGYCSRCGEFINETIPAKGHNTEAMIVLVQPTCQADGYAYGRCKDCMQWIPQSDPIVLPASGTEHVWDAGKVTTQPTCGDEGVRTFTCTICGETKTEAIPATGNHTWNSGVVSKAPTATEPGVRTYTCTVCGDTRTEVIPATGGDDPTPPPKTTFVDVPSTAYYAAAVDWAVENDITKGTDATHFSPTADCTRAQMVTFLWRALGSEAPKSSYNPFSDVRPGAYYYDAVLWAVENNITSGTSKTTFSPNDKVTRAQTVTFLWRMEGEPNANSRNPFTDVKTTDYYYKAVLWAVENGITNGMDATHFGPKNNCTRAQIVTFLWRDLDHI
ncbi:MAG: leucine-rich repeat protein [Oscillospiraceae bacterium]|nr:leucine-rich repeat protein [Oscillospiraceae bacterium]